MVTSLFSVRVKRYRMPFGVHYLNVLTFLSDHISPSFGVPVGDCPLSPRFGLSWLRHLNNIHLSRKVRPVIPLVDELALQL